ncbi:amino acid transporter [Oscillospiraceae bacterium]|nr:amino acid transporter [Oscillospiraceae bacterium]
MSDTGNSGKKMLSFTDCMSMAIGQIIGSGIMVLTGIVIGLTGHGTILAFILGAVVALCNAFPFLVLHSSIPAKGAAYTYANRLLGDKMGFFYLGMFVLSQILIATFAKGFASYFCQIFPQFNEAVIAMLALTIAVALNIIGLKNSATAQKLMVAVLLVSLALFAAFGLPQVEWSNLTITAKNMMPNGPKNFFTGVALLSFACGGAKYIAENADAIPNPSRTIPKVVILATVLVAVFYALVGIVAAGVLPVEDVAFQNLTLVARQIFPPWLYIFFVVGGAMFALFTTLNGTLSWVTRGLQVAATQGWLPERCAKENKAGTPVILLLVFFVVGAVPILTGMDLTAISNMGVGTDVLTEFVILVACWQLPKKFPKEFQSSMFHMDERLFKVILACIGVIMLGTSYVNLSDLTPINYLCLAVYLVALFIFTQVRYKHVVAKRESLVR